MQKHPRPVLLLVLIYTTILPLHTKAQPLQESMKPALSLYAPRPRAEAVSPFAGIVQTLTEYILSLL